VVNHFQTGLARRRNRKRRNCRGRTVHCDLDLVLPDAPAIVDKERKETAAYGWLRISLELAAAAAGGSPAEPKSRTLAHIAELNADVYPLTQRESVL